MSKKTETENGAPAFELYDTELEAQVLGAAMVAEGEQYFTRLGLKPSDFWAIEHKAIWRAGQKLETEGITPTLTIMADELRRQGKLDQVGGMTALAGFVQGCESALSGPSYAARVLEWSYRRQIEERMGKLGAMLSKDGRCDKEIEELRRVLDDRDAVAGGPVTFCTADEIASFYGAITWAWPSWVPIGHLTMIAGPQGQGKSYFAARLIASLSGCASTWPDGAPFEGIPPDGDPVRTLVVETEELRGEYVQRLDKMGVQRHWHVWGPGDETHIPDLAKESAKIERLAREEGCGAVIVDSLSGAHVLEERSAEMRKILQPLAGMAARLKVPVILVHHARKRTQLETVDVTLDRVRGSGTITQFCRSVLGLWRLEENDQAAPVRVETLKTNFCRPPEPFGFTITDHGLDFGEAPEAPREPTEQDRAIEFLQAALEDGPRPAGEIYDEAELAGFSRATLRLAKKKAGVLSRKEKGHRSGWTWGLPATWYDQAEIPF